MDSNREKKNHRTKKRDNMPGASNQILEITITYGSKGMIFFIFILSTWCGCIAILLFLSFQRWSKYFVLTLIILSSFFCPYPFLPPSPSSKDHGLDEIFGWMHGLVEMDGPRDKGWLCPLSFRLVHYD